MEIEAIVTLSPCGMDYWQNKHGGRRKEAEVALASARSRAVGVAHVR